MKKLLLAILSLSTIIGAGIALVGATVGVPNGSLPFFVPGAPESVSAQAPCQPNAYHTAMGCIRMDAPNCFNFNGTRRAVCQNAEAHGLQASLCYTQRTARDGSVQGYSETSCGDPTDRNQDGTPGGARASDTQRVSADCKTVPLNATNCPFLRDYVLPAIRALSGAVGVVVLIMIAWGGLQYTQSRDNPQQAAEAKDHIRNALLALVIYIFMVAFLNWLVPGGVF